MWSMTLKVCAVSAPVFPLLSTAKANTLYCPIGKSAPVGKELLLMVNGTTGGVALEGVPSVVPSNSGLALHFCAGLAASGCQYLLSERRCSLSHTVATPLPSASSFALPVRVVNLVLAPCAG